VESQDCAFSNSAPESTSASCRFGILLPTWRSGKPHAAENGTFPGWGPDWFRFTNITWRQEVGGSAIEASEIAGHSDLEMTGEYTFVAPERWKQLTRRIQERLAGSITLAVP
jgi:hypothetical protein